MRDDVKHKIDYWEITNEWDNQMQKAGRLENYWRIYNKCAAAMREVDANAKLGGPALTWANPVWVNGFLENCPDAQFISWHNYATGDLYESNEKIFSQTDSSIGALAGGVLNALQKHNRKLETFLTETNVKYTWDPYERRHQNVVGSIFHALVVKTMAEKGVTGVTLWSQKGKAYGSLIDGENKILPSYYLYRWGSEFLTGKMAAATTGDSEKLEILAVTHPDERKAILLLNKSNHTLTLPAASELLPDVKVMQSIDASDYKANIAITPHALSLPGYSLTLLTN
jgi:xylan 1,4-beta-xylosidase